MVLGGEDLDLGGQRLDGDAVSDESDLALLLVEAELDLLGGDAVLSCVVLSPHVDLACVGEGYSVVQAALCGDYPGGNGVLAVFVYGLWVLHALEDVLVLATVIHQCWVLSQNLNIAGLEVGVPSKGAGNVQAPGEQRAVFQQPQRKVLPQLDLVDELLFLHFQLLFQVVSVQFLGLREILDTPLVQVSDPQLVRGVVAEREQLTSFCYHHSVVDPALDEHAEKVLQRRYLLRPVQRLVVTVA